MSGITELREHLFDTIRQLKSGTMDNARADAICKTADKLLKSAEIELKLRQLTNDFRSGPGFLIEGASSSTMVETPVKTMEKPAVLPKRDHAIAAAAMKVRKESGNDDLEDLDLEEDDKAPKVRRVAGKYGESAD